MIMGDYSYGEIMKMQKEALRRVEDMRRRATEATAAYNEEARGGSENRRNTEVDAPNRVKMPDTYLDSLKSYGKNSSYDELKGKNRRVSEDKKPGLSGIDNIKRLLSNINVDSDTALVLSLALLLSDEGVDEEIILALLYILT